MSPFLILECSGYYSDYSEDPLFLVKTEEEAKKVVRQLNSLAKWKSSRSEESSQAMEKWKEENPAPPRDTKALARHRQIQWLLKQDFKPELKAPLVNEMEEINQRLQDYETWFARCSEVYQEHFDSMTVPDELSDVVYDALPHAHYSYVWIKVIEIE